MRKGISLIEVILAIGMIVLLFGGIYTAYVGILDAVQNSELRAAAVSVLNEKLEIIRNLPYESVGVQGGVPSGALAAEEYATSSNGIRFLIKTAVRNIDDPFDGTLGGTPNDTAPADYKLAELEASCPSCAHFVPLILTTTVAPKNLESPSTGGSLFVNVLNAAGQGVQGASVHVTNTKVTPTINLTDTTNANGVLQLVGVPTSTQEYHLVVTKSGYSSDSTYPIGGAGNPNPVKPDATVAAQTITQVSFSIDRVGTINVSATDNVCAPVGGGQAVTVKGAKIIGTNPAVLKFSTSSTLGALGTKIYDNLEWDTYTVSVSTSSYDLVGTNPLEPAVLNPGSVLDARFTLAPQSLRSLMVTVKDASDGSGIANADVRLSSGGYSKTLATGHAFLVQSDWSGGNYIDQSGMDAASSPGTLSMAGTPYSTSTESWLISKTFDVGGASSAFFALSWNPESQHPQTSLAFQIASNNDNATWNYIGPDGTANTYYTAPGTQIAAAHNGNRYLRYKVFMSTTNDNITPSLDDISLEFSGPCVPPAQVLFTGMGSGAYTLTVDAAGYGQATSSVTVSNGWQEASVPLVQ